MTVTGVGSRALAFGALAAATLAASGYAAEEPPEDFGPIVSLDLRAKKTERKRYFLIGHHLPGEDGKKPKKFEVPKRGFRLLVVMPGGGGGEGFHPFVKRIHREVLNGKWLIAQPVATKWTDDQQTVWPMAC